MPPVFYRSVALCLLATSSFACKPKADGNSSVKEAVGTSSSPSFADFNEQVAFRTLEALGGRLGDQGCQEAAHWLVEPKDKDLPAAIKAIAASDRVYETAVANLLDVHWAYKACLSGGKPVAREGGAGIRRINDTVSGKGYGLTVVVVSGVGSMFTPEGPIAEARAEWAKAGLKDFQVEYISLGEITNLDTAAQKLKAEWEAAVTKAGEKRRFLIWAHDVAGNMALDLLATNQTLRDRTLALVTVGSPIGGVVKALFADKAKQQMSNVSSTVATLIPAALSANVGKVSIAIAGMASLSPEARRTHLANQIKTANFSRTNEDGFGEKTKVFHVASAIDPANLAPLPLASVKGGQLITAMSMRQVEQAMLVPFLASMKDEPLGDGMVSLPNAIVPRAFRPQNLEVKLIALTTFDHFGLQLTRRSDETAGRSPPYAKIVDAIIEGVGPAIGGSAESSADGEGKAKSEVEKCFGSPKPSYMDDRWSCRSPCKWVCESCEAEGPDPEEACR